MEVKKVEQVLNANPYVGSYHVFMDSLGERITVTFRMTDLRDSKDFAEVLKLKNKVRSVVSRNINIEFVLMFVT